MNNLRKLPHYGQLDLFAPDFADISTRMLQDMMWRPFFALGKKPRYTPMEYKTDNVSVKIGGSSLYGVATIWDADILMWIISRIVEALDKGEEPSPQVYFTPYECLRGIRRDTGGSQYQQVVTALQRLHGTVVETNIRKPDQVPLSKGEIRRLKAGFHLLEAYGVQYEDEDEERVKGITVVLSNWLYQGVVNRRNVLTIDEDYFLIKGGLERVLYLLARKHTGRQAYYYATMRELYEKTGSDSRFSNFTVMVRKIITRNMMPEYYMMLSPKYCKRMQEGHSIELPKAYWEQETVTFWNREKLLLNILPKLSTG